MTDLIQGLLACLQRGWWGVGAWGGTPGSEDDLLMLFHIKYQEEVGGKGRIEKSRSKHMPAFLFTKLRISWKVCKPFVFISRQTKFFPPKWEMTVDLIWSKQLLEASRWGRCGFSEHINHSGLSIKGSPFLTEMSF